MDAARRAEERATQTLITKLEGGPQRPARGPAPDPARSQLRPRLHGGDLEQQLPRPPLTVNDALNPRQATQRAQVIAWYDYIKSEMPDVFFVQPDDPNYPINFAASPFPGTANRRESTTATTSCRSGNTVHGPLGPTAIGDGVVGDGILIHPQPGFTGPGSTARLTRSRPGSTRTWATCRPATTASTTTATA